MAAPATNIRLHLAHFTAALADLNAYRFGDVPGSDNNEGTLPDRYVMVDVQRTYVEPDMLDGSAIVSGWVVTVRGVGMDTDEAAERISRASDALEGERVVIDGHESTPLTFDSFGDIRRDDLRHFGDVAFTYVL